MLTDEFRAINLCIKDRAYAGGYVAASVRTWILLFICQASSTLRMNLWLSAASKSAFGKEVEVVIRKFTYKP